MTQIATSTNDRRLPMPGARPTLLIGNSSVMKRIMVEKGHMPWRLDHDSPQVISHKKLGGGA